MLWVILALIAAVLGAFSSIISKKVLRHEHALEYGAVRGLFGLLLLLFLPFIDLNYGWPVYAAIYAISLVFAAGNLYYLKSIRHSELSSTIPLMNISPLFLLLIAYSFLGERPGPLALVGVLLLVAGTYLLQMGTSKKSLLAPFRNLARSKYALYMIFAVFLYSFVSTMEKAVVGWGVQVLFLLVIFRSFVSINYLVLEWMRNGLGEVWHDAKVEGLPIFASLSLDLLSAVAYYAALAVPGALVSLIIPVKRTSTLITALAGGKLFHEHNLRLKLIACAIMIVGVALIAF